MTVVSKIKVSLEFEPSKTVEIQTVVFLAYDACTFVGAY